MTPTRIDTLRKRPDFLACARAAKAPAPAFLLQARKRPDGGDLTRVGFTCSKKIGNAVARNRAKRRLRAIARAILPSHGRPGWDYVRATAQRPYMDLEADLIRALKKVHTPR